MHIKATTGSKSIWEVIFHAFLLTMVFIFYAFDHRCDYLEQQIEPFEIALFVNYAVAAYIINFVLLPVFLYKKKYLWFTLCTAALIAIVILIEEGVIEKIYFPTTRGVKFPGIFYNLTDALPSITILAGFKFAWDALTKQREVEELRLAIKESELQYLKSQINPHFLFNNLNNLYAYALEKSAKTPKLILELSSVLRYMLYECREEYVPVTKEIENLENFINLSRLQLEDRGEVNFEKQMHSEGFQVAPLILSVFVENAFKHSGSSQSENIDIKIFVEVTTDGYLNFSCTNSFSEVSNTQSLSKGIGLENVKKRLALLYPNAHKLTIVNKSDYFSVSLQIKLV